MSQIKDFFGQVGGSVEDGDAIATALFIVELFFMFDWLVSSASPVPALINTTNQQVTAAFFPLLIVILPVTLFGILKNMFQGKEVMTREAFSLTPKILTKVQAKAGSFSSRATAKRQYYKKYGRGVRYREQKEEKEEHT